MKLIITVVEDVESEEDAASSYYHLEECWTVISATLDGKVFHPALVEEK